MIEKPIYKVSVAFVYPTPEGPRERSLSIDYRADDVPSAILHGLRWAKNRADALGHDFGTVACVKVYGYVILSPDENGYIASGIMGCLYEWKYDWGTTFEQELEQARRV